MANNMEINFNRQEYFDLFISSIYSLFNNEITGTIRFNPKGWFVSITREENSCVVIVVLYKTDPYLDEFYSFNLDSKFNRDSFIEDLKRKIYDKPIY